MNYSPSTQNGKDSVPIDISIIIPVYNEEENIVPLATEIETVMASLPYSWQLLFVDDGSTDGTSESILKLVAQKKYIRYLRFRKNSGQSAALDAGFRTASGTWVITLDGDGQNNPADIPQLIAAALEGYDLVAGRRRRRCDSQFKKIISRSANFIRRNVLDDHISDTGCSLKIYRHTALEHIRLYRGMHRFLPALFQIEGFRVKEIDVDHRPRHAGETKYNFFSRGISTVWDLLSVLWMRRRHLSYEIEREAP
jgi:glycosyltransferase involved in cell wall biosynthesis